MPARKKSTSRAASAAAAGREALRDRLLRQAEPLARAALQALFDCRPADLVDPASAAVLLRRGLDSEALLPALRRQGRASLERELDRLRRSGRAATDLLPPGGADRLRRFLGEPTWFHGEWVRKLAANAVLEQVMGATLYEVLREFVLTVNPFFSGWGLPALLKKAGPLGKLGLFGVSLESGGRMLEGLREEFERQLEPHLRAFLQKSARAALLRAVDLARSEERLAAFAELRVRLFDELLSTRLSGLPPHLETLDRLEELLFGLLQDGRAVLLESDLEARLAGLLQRSGARTLAGLLQDHGLDPEALLEPLARALTPALRVVFGSEPVIEWFERLIEPA
jgi:hypothetical protein